MFTKIHKTRNMILSVLLMMAMALTMSPLTAAPAYAAATTWTVTSTADASFGSGTSGTFRWCVEQANATSGTHTINFEFAGTLKTVMLYAPIEIKRSMTINGSGAIITTYGMENISWGAVRTVKDSGATVYIRRLRFSGCSLKTEGAALHNSAGNTMYVESCIFDGNHTNTGGGTGGAFATVGIARVRGCTFYQNYASGTSGGGGAIANYAYCEVYDNVFYGNYTTTNIAGKTIKAFSSATGTLCYRNVYDDNAGGVNLVSPNDNYQSGVLSFNPADFRPTGLVYQLLDTWPGYYQYDFYGNDKTVRPPSIAQYAIGAVTILAAKKPIITTQPYNGNQFRTFYSDQAPDSLSVQAFSPDSATLSYQWYKDSSPVSGATSATYSPPTPWKIGISNYYCRVTNSNPWSSAYVNSDTIPIIFKPCFPTVTLNGGDAVYARGEAAAPLSVTASTRDDGALTYRWWRNNTGPVSNGATEIPGANTAEYTPPADEAGIMYYSCTVNNNSDALPNFTTGQSVPWVKITVTADASTFIAVTDITGVATTATAGAPLPLTGTVAPQDATNKTIVWSVKNAGATGATLSGNVLNTTAEGTAVVTATIANGLTATTPYTQDFTITITSGPQKGDTVYFGTYEQTNDGGDGEPIAWKVLKNAGGKLFLLSEKNLDAKPYHVNNLSVTWEGSTIRSWLNGYGAGINIGGIDYSSAGDSFTDTAFTEAERASIATTSAVNDDKIFLLSLSEVTNTDYGFTGDYNSTDTRVAVNTAYVASLPGMDSEGSPYPWWLRSPGNSDDRYATLVNSYGSVYAPGSLVASFNVAARPAINLNLELCFFKSESGSEKTFSAIPKSFIKPVITTSVLPGGKVGTAYNKKIDATAGSEYSPVWSVASGNLPTGLTLTQDGTISGTPTAAGTFTFAIRAENAGGPDTKDYTVVIEAATCAFTRSAGAGGTVSGTADGSYAQGAPISVTATANSGYRFKNWTANGVTLPGDTANPLTFAMPANAVTLIANFEADSGGDDNDNDNGDNNGDNNGDGGHNNTGNNGGDKQQTSAPPVAVKDIPATRTPVAPGVNATLPESITFPDGTSADVTWTSSDPSIARIDANGNIVAGSEGKVTLTARTADGKTQTITVTIAKPVTSVRTPLTKIYLKKGKVLTPPVCAYSVYKATKKAETTAKLTWRSSKPMIAAVNPSTGKITPKKTGNTVITATALNGKAKLKITVYVVKKSMSLKKVSLTKPPTSLKKGKTAILKIKATPANATNLKVTFTSSKPKIIQVDKAGKLTALKKGKAKITVKIGKKKYVRTIMVQ